MLSFDIDSKELILTKLSSHHSSNISFLRECSYSENIVPSNNLAIRIEKNILYPIENALKIIEICKEIGVENIPTIVIERWSLVIEKAILAGGHEHGV
ncbi:hypothetical protein OAU99_01615 [Candidatus Poseidoniaceae archaeon]|nr:hypothetical protein [Candidatus Poseidoniaceae archaeon]